MRRFAVLMSLGLSWEFAPTPALAEFVPGRIYLADAGIENCSRPYPNDRDLIWEVDPATGSSRVFAEVTHPLCGAMYGATFTADGSRLRVSTYLHNSILEIDGDGNVAVALDGTDGLTGPAGSNNLAYDDAGNFFVVAGGRRILRFPAGGGSAEIFADAQDGVQNVGAIDIAPNGDVFYLSPGNGGVARLTRFSPDGVPTLFPDRLSTWDFGTLAVDDIGDLYVWDLNGIYRYPGGVAGTREFVAGNPSQDILIPSITYSPVDGLMYLAAQGRTWSLDRVTGDTELIARSEFPGRFVSAGIGSAVFVPEPSSVLILALAGAAFARSRQSRSPDVS